VIDSGLAVVARAAQATPEPLVPELVEVSPVRLPMVYHPGCYEVLTVYAPRVGAERVLRKELLTGLLPSVAV